MAEQIARPRKDRKIARPRKMTIEERIQYLTNEKKLHLTHTEKTEKSMDDFQSKLLDPLSNQAQLEERIKECKNVIEQHNAEIAQHDAKIVELEEQRAKKGVKFFGQTVKKLVTSAGAVVGDLQREGISLSIPPESLSNDVEIRIDRCLKCPLKLPDGYKPASPVYFIEVTDDVHFDKKIKVELLHYIDLDTPLSSERMVFMTSAPQSTLNVYHFTKVEQGEGSFQQGSQVGNILLDHFCGVLIAIKKDEQNVQEDELCTVRLYRNISIHRAVMCICLKHPHFVQVCDDRISKEYIGYATSGEGRTFVSVKFKSGAANAEIEINDPQQWLLELEKENTISKEEVYFYEEDDLNSDPDYPPRILIKSVRRQNPHDSSDDGIPRLIILGVTKPCRICLRDLLPTPVKASIQMADVCDGIETTPGQKLPGPLQEQHLHESDLLLPQVKAVRGDKASTQPTLGQRLVNIMKIAAPISLCVAAPVSLVAGMVLILVSVLGNGSESGSGSGFEPESDGKSIALLATGIPLLVTGIAGVIAICVLIVLCCCCYHKCKTD